MTPLPPGTHHPSLPSSSSNSENTTPVPSASPSDPKKKPPAKRKRTADSANDNADSAAQPRTRDGPKKKKANRACFHCQKAHLTCDDSFIPEALKRAKSGEGSSKSAEPTTQSKPPDPAPPQPPPQPGAPHPPQPQQQYISPDAMFPVYNVNPSVAASFGIPAEAANLEYSILSAILGGSPDSGSGGSPGIAHAAVPQPGPGSVSSAGPSSYAPAQSSGLSAASWPAEPISGQYVPGQPDASPGYAPTGAPPYGEQPQVPIQATPVAGGVPPEYIAPGAPGYPTAYSAQPSQGGPSQYGEYDQPQAPALQGQVQPQHVAGGVPGAPPYSPSPQSFLVRPRRQMSVASPTGSKWNGTSFSAVGGSGNEGAVQSVYRNVTKGYDYTEGYHFLMKHMTRRFEKNDILRIVRALAIVRPSFIALQMPMTEEDDVFVEKCFQRSLIELDKLVSFSGTPTVAWRRTGEICLVGPEFCMLTGWEREELVGPSKRKYIYELFENQSVVEYWENFANHAFENTTQSVYSHCVLLKPSGAPVPCTFCFSIRRDIMDLPSLVIGQWLPLL
ncbi:transporter [Ganoderma sinense ZZ0214-1]|uniref:Transporter n=1 Tax=Ganoderma sinense ZZ0214-1 TaxID=1077348 RepID=A0A2G8SQX3_9APHY|nr:transporter [Ganoderma sinense ZZ0214-1]